MKYSILIPAYNEASVIGDVLDRLGKPAGCQEIIVVDDGSTDGTAAAAKTRPVRVISHPTNRGYGAALKTGIRAASSEFVICYDGDGQHKVESLLDLTRAPESFDLVIGVRQPPFGDWIRKPGRKLLGWFVNLLAGSKTADFNSGLRAFRSTAIREVLHLMPDGFSFSTTSTVAFYKMGYRVREVPITVNTRVGRKSSVRIVRDGVRLLMLILNLTVLFDPQQIFVPAALGCIGASWLYFLVYSLQERIHVTPSMTMLFLTGVNLFFLGVVCEQISALRREKRATPDGPAR